MVAASEIISRPQSRRRFLHDGLRGFRAEINDQKSLITDQKKRIPADLFTAARFVDSSGLGMTQKSGQSVESVVHESTVPPVPMSTMHKPRSGLCLGGENPLLFIDHCPLVIERSADPSGHDTKRTYHPPQTQQGQQHNQARRAHGARASQQHAAPNQTHAEKPPSAGAAQDAAAAEGKRRTVMNFGQAAHQDQARIASLRANWQQDYNARLGLIHSNLSDAQLYSLMQHDVAQINTLQHGLTALHGEFDKAGLNQVTLPTVAIPHGEDYTLVHGGSGFENAARMAGEIGSAWAAEQSGNLGGLGPTYDEVAFAIGGPVDDLVKATGEKVAEDVGEKAPGLLGKIGGWIKGLFGKTEDIGASKRVIGNAERSFLNSEHFESLPVSGTVDPSKIRFSQASAGASFKAGGEVDKLATDLKSGALKPEDVPPVRIVVRDGQVYTLDNRRLAAFQRAGVQIHYVKLDAIPKGEMYKFTTTNHGVDIQLRRPSQ